MCRQRTKVTKFQKTGNNQNENEKTNQTKTSVSAQSTKQHTRFSQDDYKSSDYSMFKDTLRKASYG